MSRSAAVTNCMITHCWLCAPGGVSQRMSQSPYFPFTSPCANASPGRRRKSDKHEQDQAVHVVSPVARSGLTAGRNAGARRGSRSRARPRVKKVAEARLRRPRRRANMPHKPATVARCARRMTVVTRRASGCADRRAPWRASMVGCAWRPSGRRDGFMTVVARVIAALAWLGRCQASRSPRRTAGRPLELGDEFPGAGHQGDGISRAGSAGTRSSSCR